MLYFRYNITRTSFLCQVVFRQLFLCHIRPFPIGFSFTLQNSEIERKQTSTESDKKTSSVDKLLLMNMFSPQSGYHLFRCTTEMISAKTIEMTCIREFEFLNNIGYTDIRKG